MPRPCSICTHPRRSAIDQALTLDRASLRDIARQWRVSKDAIARHRDHIPQALVKATQNERFAWDAYRRFIQMFGSVVLGLEKREFEDVIEAHELVEQGGVPGKVVLAVADAL